MILFQAVLEAVDPTRNCFRSYRLEAGTDLFGTWLVAVTFGRIGTGDRRVCYCVDDEDGARKLIRENKTARKRIGVAYCICEWSDPQEWLLAPNGSDHTQVHTPATPGIAAH